MLSKARRLEAKIIGFNTTLKKNIQIRVTEDELLFFLEDKLLGGMTQERFINTDLPEIWKILKLGEADVKEPIY